METKWFHSLAPAVSVAGTDQIRGWSYWIRRRSLLVGVRAGLSHCECSGPNKSNFRYCYCMSENADVFNPFKPHVCHCINLFQLLDFACKLKSCSPTWHKVNMALEFCPGHQCKYGFTELLPLSGGQSLLSMYILFAHFGFDYLCTLSNLLIYLLVKI